MNSPSLPRVLDQHVVTPEEALHARGALWEHLVDTGIARRPFSRAPTSRHRPTRPSPGELRHPRLGIMGRRVFGTVAPPPCVLLRGDSTCCGYGLTALAFGEGGVSLARRRETLRRRRSLRLLVPSPAA